MADVTMFGSSQAVSGLGTRVLRWNSEGSAGWEDIAEVSNASGPGMTRDFIEVTSFQSAGGYREFIAGFRDGGTVSLTMNFVSSSYMLMKNDFEEDSPQYYQIVLPDTNNTSLVFPGLVTELPLEIPTDDKITANVTIKIVGYVEVSKGMESSDPTGSN